MKRSFGILSALIFAPLLTAQAQTDYVKEIEKWRGEREAKLKTETGWLTVAGLSWLKEGKNTVGAGESFNVRLTDNFKQGKTFRRRSSWSRMKKASQLKFAPAARCFT
jgi:hypothetical protein